MAVFFMKFLKSHSIAITTLTCIATLVFLCAGRLFQSEPEFKVIDGKIHSNDLDALAMFDSNEKNVKIGPIISLDDASHLEPLKKLINGTIVLDFYATWCGPCRRQGRLFEQMARDDQFRDAVVIKIDIDQHPELAQQFDVVTVPKLVVLKKGKVSIEKSGFADSTTVQNWLDPEPTQELEEFISTSVH